VGGRLTGPAGRFSPISFKFALDDGWVGRTKKRSYCRGSDLAGFGGPPDVAMLITDSGLDADVAARLEAAGPRVVRA
jgi:hypothetical protein